jgi:hypothetical protein
MTKIAFIDDDPAVRRGLLEAVRLHSDVVVKAVYPGLGGIFGKPKLPHSAPAIDGAVPVGRK